MRQSQRAAAADSSRQQQAPFLEARPRQHARMAPNQRDGLCRQRHPGTTGEDKGRNVQYTVYLSASLLLLCSL